MNDVGEMVEELQRRNDKLAKEVQSLRANQRMGDLELQLTGQATMAASTSRSTARSTRSKGSVSAGVELEWSEGVGTTF